MVETISKLGHISDGLPNFDPKAYLSYLDGFEISEEQKTEILKSLWNIMATFAQISFGMDSAQLVAPPLKTDGGRLENEAPSNSTLGLDKVSVPEGER